MKDLCIWLVAIVTIASGCRFAYQVRSGAASVTLSTWIIALTACGLSLATYAVAEKHDFRSGILNFMDVFGTAIIVFSVLRWGKRGLRLKPFEKWYLGGVMGVLLIWWLTGNAVGSNLVAQVLLLIAYIPTLQNLLTTKRNSESFTGWGLGLTASTLALYPAFSDGNTLAEVYAVRAVASVIIVLSLMTYYELRNRPKVACGLCK